MGDGLFALGSDSLIAEVAHIFGHTFSIVKVKH
jgi:hypothetical protein